MAFDSREFEYADIKAMILGIPLEGLRGITYKEKFEKEVVYGQGNEPKAIQRGNISYEGQLMLLKSDVDIMNAAARAAGYKSITRVPGRLIDITVVYQKSDDATQLNVDTLQNVEFSELEDGQKQGDKFKEVTLPLIFLRLKQR